MTATELIALIRPRYSMRNALRKEQEELVMASFKDFLFKIEGTYLMTIVKTIHFYLENKVKFVFKARWFVRPDKTRGAIII